jgi:hypothetical protein
MRVLSAIRSSPAHSRWGGHLEQSPCRRLAVERRPCPPSSTNSNATNATKCNQSRCPYSHAERFARRAGPTRRHSQNDAKRTRKGLAFSQPLALRPPQFFATAQLTSRSSKIALRDIFFQSAQIGLISVICVHSSPSQQFAPSAQHPSSLHRSVASSPQRERSQANPPSEAKNPSIVFQSPFSGQPRPSFFDGTNPNSLAASPTRPFSAPRHPRNTPSPRSAIRS